MFASMTAAFEGLGDRTQRLISGLVGIHDFKPFRTLFGSDAEDHKQLRALEEQYPLRNHPIVRVHPESGPLLAILFDQANRPEYKYRLRWRPGTIVLWDNRAALHYAVHDYFPQRRRMERVTIKGDVPFGVDAGYNGPVIDSPAVETSEQDAVLDTGEEPIRQSTRNGRRGDWAVREP